MLSMDTREELTVSSNPLSPEVDQAAPGGGSEIASKRGGTHTSIRHPVQADAP
jgi:hypothetical protein